LFNSIIHLLTHFLSLTLSIQFASSSQPLDELKICLEALEDALKTPSVSKESTGKQFAIEGFILPVSYYFDEESMKR